MVHHCTGNGGRDRRTRVARHGGNRLPSRRGGRGRALRLRCDGRFVFLNPAALKILGYHDPAELVGQPSHETIHYLRPDGSPFPAAQCALLRPSQTGETLQLERDSLVCRKHQDGESLLPGGGLRWARTNWWWSPDLSPGSGSGRWGFPARRGPGGHPDASDPHRRHRRAWSARGSRPWGSTCSSTYIQIDEAVDLFSATASRVGYLLKDSVANLDQLIDALTRISEGGTVLDPKLVAELLGRTRRADPLGPLTPREREVLALAAEGRSNAGIAKALWITEGAVEKHIKRIFSKLEIPATPARTAACPTSPSYRR